jgi:photosystem II stability/assembly factor-like uncharacterized protein
VATGKVEFGQFGGLGVYVFDQAGELEWNRIYQESFTFLNGCGILEVEDGGYVIVGGSGKIYYNGDERPQVLIYKTDHRGNFD